MFKNCLIIRFLVLVNLFCLLLLVSCSEAEHLNDNSEESKPKYIFYFIADGLGYSHISLTEAYLANIDTMVGVKPLVMTNFPIHGMLNTYSKNRQITGSAAAGTALARGAKENIDMIGYFEGDYKNHPSLIQLAENNNMSTGLISNVSLNHATPAAFYANVDDREKYYEIGLQLAKIDVNFLGGGGIYKNKGVDGDKPDIFRMLRDSLSFSMASSSSEIDYTVNNLYFLNPVLHANSEMPFIIDRHKYPSSYTTSDIVDIAINFLKDKGEFLLVVEGGKIDWAAHDNDAAALIHEIIDFDKSVKKAFDFYERYPDETLIIVTSDHETGGLALGINDNAYKSDFAVLQKQKISQSQLSYLINEKYNNKAGGVLTFNNLLKILENDFYKEGFVLSESEIQDLRIAYKHYMSPDIIGSKYKELYRGNCPVSYTATTIINNRASVGFTSGYHTAAAVPVFSIGKGSENFGSYLDNTDIFTLIKDIMHWE